MLVFVCNWYIPYTTYTPTHCHFCRNPVAIDIIKAIKEPIIYHKNMRILTVTIKRFFKITSKASQLKSQSTGLDMWWKCNTYLAIFRTHTFFALAIAGRTTTALTLYGLRIASFLLFLIRLHDRHYCFISSQAKRRLIVAIIR